MRSEQEIKMERLQEVYQKLMFGDEKSVGLLDVSNHLSDSVNELSSNNKNGLDFNFEKEVDYISNISKKTIPMISDFRQSLSFLGESSQNITLSYDEYMELSNNLDGVAETIKNSISQIGDKLEQYDKLLDQKLKNMYAVDVKQVDLTLVLNVAEALSAEKNCSERFQLAAKELTRVLDRDIKQIQKTMEENIKRGATMNYNDIINGYEQKMNQSWDQLMYDSEHVDSNLYNTMYQNHSALKELTKLFTSDVGSVISSSSMVNELLDVDFRKTIQERMFEAEKYMNETNERMNTVPQNHYDFFENTTIFQNMVNDLSVNGNLNLLSDQELDKIATMTNRSDEQIEYLNNVSYEMYNQSQFMLKDMEDLKTLFCENLQKLEPVLNGDVGKFIDDVAEFIDKSNKFYTDIANELSRQKTERGFAETYVERNKDAITQIKEMSQEKEEIFIE